MPGIIMKKIEDKKEKISITSKKELYNVKIHKGGYSYNQDWQEHYPPIIELVPPNSYVLDVGCGRGGLLEYLRDKKNCRVTGLDITRDAVSFCREKGIAVIKCDLEEEEIPGVYDVIILSAVLEHLIDPLFVLEKFRNNLRDKGYVIVGVPNFSHIRARISYLLGRNVTRFGNDKKDKKLVIQPYGHIQFYNKATLSHILHKKGYKPVQWSYLSYYRRSYNTSLLRKFFVWGFYKVYRVNPELFSGFIAVKAVKEGK